MHQQQMTFAEIGTLYNTISTELEGGVTPKNKELLLDQATVVQTQIQSLINSGSLEALGGATVTHAQNIADQLNFVTQGINAFGTDAFAPKFINDVVRDIQDIVAADANLSTLAHQAQPGIGAWQQESFLLTNPTPFMDSAAQTAFLTQFISDSNSLGAQAQALAGADPHSDAVLKLEADLTAFSHNADAFANAAEQIGVYHARFENELGLDGVQGTAVREILQGLQTGNADLVNGASTVLEQNAMDIGGNNQSNGKDFNGNVVVTVPNGGIPAVNDTVHTAGLIFDDAFTKLIGGVASTNHASVLADLAATTAGLTAAIGNQNITGEALKDVNQIIGLLNHESALVAGIDPAQATPISPVNGQLNDIEKQILNIVNHDATLATMAVGADGTVGFVALPPGTGHGNVVASPESDVGQPGHNDIVALTAQHMWGH
jgi:trimeric autotransporter adhesin